MVVTSPVPLEPDVAWVQSLLVSSCVIVGKLLRIPRPLFSPLCNVDDNNPYVERLG